MQDWSVEFQPEIRRMDGAVVITTHQSIPGLVENFSDDFTNATDTISSVLWNGCQSSDSNYTQLDVKCSGPATEDPTIRITRLLAEVYLTIPIAVLGIIGNMLSLVILNYYRRKQRMHTILIQLQALAVVDTLILINGLLLR
jgi:hypothetical protein